MHNSQSIRFSISRINCFGSCFLSMSIVLLEACTSSVSSTSRVNIDTIASAVVEETTFEEESISEMEETFLQHQLIDVQTLDSSILVDLKYASNDNFLDTNIYGNIKKAYLQKEVAKKLAKASEILQSTCDSCRLLIYDAARPQSVQYKMWEKIKRMPVQQGVYVSNPAKGSVHNFGAAIDLTIANHRGEPLDMGTPFDYFGKEAWITSEDSLVRAGKLTREQVSNRRLLRSVMQKAGFRAIPSEWWHFNAYSRPKAQELFPIIK